MRGSSSSIAKAEGSEARSNSPTDSFDWFADEQDENDFYEETSRTSTKPTLSPFHFITLNFISWVCLGLAVLMFIPIILIFIGIKMQPWQGIPALHWFIMAVTALGSFTVSGWLVSVLIKLFNLSSYLRASDFMSYVIAISFPLHTLIWSGVNIGVWNHILRLNNEKSVVIFPFLLCVLITAGMFAIEVLFLEFISNSFHERAFKRKIMEVKFKSYVLGELLSYSRQQEPPSLDRVSIRVNCCGMLSRRDVENATDQQSEDSTPLMSNDNGRLKLTFNRFKKTLGHIAAKYTHIEYYDPLQLPTLYETKRAARDVFLALHATGHDFLTHEDFQVVFGEGNACSDAFAIFDIDKDGVINRRDFRSNMIQIYKERENLTKSIHDTGSALWILRKILDSVIMIILLLIYLTVFNVPTDRLFAAIVAVAIAIYFLIGKYSRIFFSSILMLFVTHPFDVGDTITVDHDTLTVIEIHLLTTIFKNWDGSEVYIPNDKLSTATITNLNRATEQWEKVEFEINLSTSEKQLTDLREKIRLFLRENSLLFYPQFEMVPKESPSLEKLFFNIRVRCKPTRDARKKWDRHGKLLQFLKQTVDHLGIVYYNAK